MGMLTIPGRGSLGHSGAPREYDQAVYERCVPRHGSARVSRWRVQRSSCGWSRSTRGSLAETRSCRWSSQCTGAYTH